jgi:hypothetical protein
MTDNIDPLEAFKAQRSLTRQDQIPNGVYAASVANVELKKYQHDCKWELNIWYGLKEWNVVVSDYYTTNGIKLYKLQEALGFKLGELQGIDHLLDLECRLRLRRNNGYPRYKILEVLPPETTPTETQQAPGKPPESL